MIAAGSRNFFSTLPKRTVTISGWMAATVPMPNAFRYPVKVVLGTGENEEIVEGVIDTGSPVCGVTKRLADKFGLKKLGATSVSPAFGGKSERMLYCVDFLLEDCLRFSDMRATEIEKGYDGAEFIVGCNVLCLGDFVITNKDRKTTISLRLPSDKEIDFMVE